MPEFTDRPLPPDFQVVPIAPRKKVMPRKPKGAISKINRSLKEGILSGAAAYGVDGSGEGGLNGYLAMCAARFPKAYLQLLGRLVPLQLHSESISGGHIGTVNIVSVPSGSYLSHVCDPLKHAANSSANSAKAIAVPSRGLWYALSDPRIIRSTGGRDTTSSKWRSAYPHALPNSERSASAR